MGSVWMEGGETSVRGGVKLLLLAIIKVEYKVPVVAALSAILFCTLEFLGRK